MDMSCLAESTQACFFFYSIIYYFIFLKVSRFPSGLCDCISVSLNEGRVASLLCCFSCFSEGGMASCQSEMCIQKVWPLCLSIIMKKAWPLSQLSVINEAWPLCFVPSSPSGAWPLSLSVTAVIVM